MANAMGPKPVSLRERGIMAFGIRADEFQRDDNNVLQHTLLANLPKTV